VDRLVTLASFDNDLNAHLLIAKLEEAGIKACMDNYATVSNIWALSNAVGGIQIQIFEKDINKALAVVDELGDAFPSRSIFRPPDDCPQCGSYRVGMRRLSLPVLFAVVITLGIFVLWLRNESLQCKDCGHIWDRSKDYEDDEEEETDTPTP